MHTALNSLMAPRKAKQGSSLDFILFVPDVCTPDRSFPAAHIFVPPVQLSSELSASLSHNLAERASSSCLAGHAAVSTPFPELYPIGQNVVDCLGCLLAAHSERVCDGLTCTKTVRKNAPSSSLPHPKKCDPQGADGTRSDPKIAPPANSQQTSKTNRYCKNKKGMKN